MTIEQQLERRIVTSLLVEPALWFVFADVELDDFSDYRCRVWFSAIRDLQAKECDVSALAVLDRLADRDRQDGGHVAEHANGAWLAEGIFMSALYRVPSLAQHDAQLLRAIAARRRLEPSAAPIAEVA